MKVLGLAWSIIRFKPNRTFVEGTEDLDFTNGAP